MVHQYSTLLFQVFKAAGHCFVFFLASHVTIELSSSPVLQLHLVRSTIPYNQEITPQVFFKGNVFRRPSRTQGYCFTQSYIAVSSDIPSKPLRFCEPAPTPIWDFRKEEKYQLNRLPSRSQWHSVSGGINGLSICCCPSCRKKFFRWNWLLRLRVKMRGMLCYMLSGCN